DEPAEARPPAVPVEVIFSAPVPGEVGVPPDSRVRVQFSKGLDEATLADDIRITYVGEAEPLGFTADYDGATRSITIRFAEPLERFRTVRVELLEGIRGFDDAPFIPYSWTFTVAD